MTSYIIQLYMYIYVYTYIHIYMCICQLILYNLNVRIYVHLYYDLHAFAWAHWKLLDCFSHIDFLAKDQDVIGQYTERRDVLLKTREAEP